MSEKLPKYRVVQAQGYTEFIEKVNALVEQGYRVHTFASDPNDWIAYMSLKTDSKYQNISHLADVAPDDVDKYLADGWVVAESWAKKVRMVLPNEV